MALPASVYACEFCRRVYNHKVLSKCPGCSGEGLDPSPAKSAPTKSRAPIDVRYNSAEAGTSELLELLIEETRKNRAAANRTTYAIRSAISYIAIMGITAAIVTIIISSGNSILLKSGDPDTIVVTYVIAIIVALAGLFTAQYQFLKQWRLSKVPA